jgi:hypothetical protein
MNIWGIQQPIVNKSKWRFLQQPKENGMLKHVIYHQTLDIDVTF